MMGEQPLPGPPAQATGSGRFRPIGDKTGSEAACPMLDLYTDTRHSSGVMRSVCRPSHSIVQTFIVDAERLQMSGDLHRAG